MHSKKCKITYAHIRSTTNPKHKKPRKLHQSAGQISQNQYQRENLKNREKERHTRYRGTKIRMTADFCLEIMPVRKQQSDISKVLTQYI